MHRFACILALTAASTAADARCAFYGLEVGAIAGKDVTIAGDGGILVAAVAVQGSGALDQGDVAVQPTWRVRVENGKIDALTPTVETLAPGLAVYRVATPARELALETAAGKTIATARVAAGPVVPKLAAPKVKTAELSGSHDVRRPWGKLAIQIEGSVPAGAVAIIAADEKGVARSWGKVAAGEQLIAYESHRCQTLPNGTVASQPGDKIVLMWVDASGRTSPASKPVVVGGTIETDASKTP